VFDGGTGTQNAVPLSRVSRLEEIPVERIEHADGRQLIQYRGALLPLIPLSSGLAAAIATSPGQTWPIIVCNDGDISLGLAVHEIRDIIEDRVSLEVAPKRPGVLGTAVIAGRATEVVDIGYYMEQSRNARYRALEQRSEVA
jgi:two-component system chemotaxis sensor kinase CheA